MTDLRRGAAPPRPGPEPEPPGGGGLRSPVVLAAVAPGASPTLSQALLVAAVWLAFTAPQVVTVLLVGRGFVPIGEEAQGAEEPLLATVTTAANTILVLVCAGLVMSRLRSLRPLAWLPAVLLAVPWLWSAGLLVALGRRPGLTALLYVAIAAAAWAVRPRLATVRALGVVTVATATISLLLGLVVPDLALYQDYSGADLDKDAAGIGILAGLLPSGNNLGLVLAVGLAAVATLPRWWRALGLALTLSAVAWSLSRTALLAVVVVGLLALGLALARRRDRTRAPGPDAGASAGLVAGAGLGVLLAASLVLPLTARSSSAYANRGGYWVRGLELWREAPLTGHGPDWFKEVAGQPGDLGGFAYHAHNQLVQSLVTGGLVLTVAVLAILVVGGLRAVRAARVGHWWPTLFLGALLAVAMFEVPIGFVDRTAFFPWVLLGLCVLLLAPEGARREAAAHRSGAGPPRAAQGRPEDPGHGEVDG